ncbi:MAG: energy-coupling factor ABC transporter substrate-binding protein [Alphaproteobacteria bacterium]|jgi:cobalt/nickel transport protein|nr:energy-coupling factor ABC transporter substrate-binding protein [Alphaproteobacteria bacterium]
MSRTNQLLIALAALIIAAPLMIPGFSGSFEGADAQAQASLKEQGIVPWLAPLWTPPSGEIESLLFALQAALGAGLFGYVLGRRQGRKKSDDAA